MNKHLKRLVCFACGTVLTVGAVALSACGEGAGSYYDGIGSEFIVSHSDGKTVTYVFEAENTNLTNKSGPSSSGKYTGKAMAVQGDGASNGYCVTGLQQLGNSVNFIVVCDRDIENATLILTLGAETKLSYSLSPDNYQVRVDPVNDVDLNDYDDPNNGGAWGMWDSEFLNVYNDKILSFNGYYLTTYDCGNLEVEAISHDPSGFQDYKVTTKLKLWKGVNSISLITNNEDIPQSADAATYTASAPVVDCIKIVTNAQMGLYQPQDNSGKGTANACTFS